MTETPTVTAPLAVSAMQIQMRVGDQRKDIVFSVAIDATADDRDLHDLLDRMTRAVDREKLKSHADDLRLTIQRNREVLQTGKFDRDINELQRQRAEADKVHSIRWAASSRRGERKPSERQQTELAKFDQQIETIVKAKTDVQKGLPVTEYQLACLEARIAGQPEPPMPDNVKDALMSLDMPEDVGFSQAAA